MRCNRKKIIIEREKERERKLDVREEDLHTTTIFQENKVLYCSSVRFH